MGFRPANFAHLARFNSAVSSDFLDFYENFVDEQIRKKNSEPSHKTFAPSGFRCKRKMWFRLRGTEPDQPKQVDRVLNFTAEIGTACHKIIQSNLKQALQDDWIDVKQYLEENPVPFKYNLEQDADSLETKIEFFNPPIRFACDGIVRWKGKLYLLEIKTSEYSSFDELTDPKSEHIMQVKCYATLLGLSGVIFMYQDRQYGSIKVYEYFVSENDKQVVLDTMKYVQEMVDANLAPEPLSKGDKWCSSNYCPYYLKCSQWGR